MNQRKVGVLLSYCMLASRSIIGFIFIPMLLYYLTQSQYGVYQLMGSIIMGLSIMDFGLSNTTTRYVARTLALKDDKQLYHVIATSHTIYTVITVGLLVLGSILYFCIDPIYSATLSVQELYDAKRIYLLMLLNMAVTIQGNIFTATINAHERFIFMQGLNLIQIIMQPLLVWAILAWKASAFNVVLAQTVVIWATLLCKYIYCKRKLALSFPWQLAKTPLFRELTGFSFFVFLHVLMDQVYYRSGQFILGAVSGTKAVATYAIAIQIIAFAITLPASVNNIFLPKLSASIATQNNLREPNELFCKLGRLQFMLFMLIFIGFCFVGRGFILLWVGEKYSKVYGLVLILMSGYILDVSQSLGNAILQAMKKHAFRAYVYTAMAVLNVLLAIVLGKRYGEMGCAVATAICLCLGPGLAINWYYHRIGINLKLFFENIARICVGIVPAVLLCIVFFMVFPLQNTWVNFLWHGVVLTLIYAGCMWGFAFNAYEKQLVLSPLYKLGILKQK